MASSNIRALEIAIEPSYCNLSNGIPSTTGLTFQSVEFIDAAQVSPISETMQESEEGGKGGYYGIAPDVVQTSGGQIIKKGEITLDFYLRARGPSNLIDGLRALLGTRFALNDKESATAAITATSSNTITVDESSFAEVGDVIAVQSYNNSPCFYTHVIDTTAGTNSTILTVAPSLYGVVQADDVVKVLADFRLPTFGGDPVRTGSSSPYSTTSFPTCCIRLTGDGWRQVCYGCQLTALTISGTDGDSRAVKLSATVNVAYAEDTAAATPPVGVRYGSQIEHSLASPLMVSESYLSAAPTTAITASAQPCVDEWTLTLTWTCESSNCGNLWLGKAPLEAVGLEASLDMYLGGTTQQTNLMNQFKDSEYCAISLGFNADLTEDGQTAGAVIIPAAYIANGSVSTVDLGSGFIRTHVEMGIGPNNIDASGDKPMFQLAIA